MKPPGSAKAFTSGELTTEKCQSRLARLVREAIDCPSAVTNRLMAVSRMSGISESIFAASQAPMARSCSGETEQAAATARETIAPHTAILNFMRLLLIMAASRPAPSRRRRGARRTWQVLQDRVLARRHPRSWRRQARRQVSPWDARGRRGAKQLLVRRGR